MRRVLLALLALFLAGCEKAVNDAWQGYIEGEFVLLASPYAGQRISGRSSPSCWW